MIQSQPFVERKVEAETGFGNGPDSGGTPLAVGSNELLCASTGTTCQTKVLFDLQETRGGRNAQHRFIAQAEPVVDGQAQLEHNGK